MSALNKLEFYLLAQEWLATEAKLLDERRFRDWYEMLDDELVYHVPLRQARIEYADEVPKGAYRILDSKEHVLTRIKRLETGAAWAEMPPSRTLRLVGSVMVKTTDKPDVIEVESALLLFRQRNHGVVGDTIPVRRTDTLRLVDGQLKLQRREAMISEVVLMTPNLGVFI